MRLHTRHLLILTYMTLYGAAWGAVAGGCAGALIGIFAFLIGALFGIVIGAFYGVQIGAILGFVCGCISVLLYVRTFWITPAYRRTITAVCVLGTPLLQLFILGNTLTSSLESDSIIGAGVILLGVFFAWQMSRRMIAAYERLTS